MYRWSGDSLGSFETLRDDVMKSMAIVTPAYGGHGEIISADVRSVAMHLDPPKQRTLYFDWKGSFAKPDRVIRRDLPWDEPFSTILVLPSDLVVRNLRAIMQPFVFHGTVVVRSKEYGTEDVYEYDDRGLATRHEAFPNGQKGKSLCWSYRFDENRNPTEQGDCTGRPVYRFRYNGDRAVGLTIVKDGRLRGGITYARDPLGRVVSASEESDAGGPILTRYEDCQN